MHQARFHRPALAGLVCAAVAAAVVASGVAALAADPAPAAGPKRKDTSTRLRPKEVDFKVAVQPEQAKAGDTVTYQVTAKVQEPWHIYAYGTTQPAIGPRNTQFDFFDAAGLKLAGDWTASREPSRAKEAVFPDIPYLEFYEGEVTWSVPLLVPPGTPPGPKTLRCQVGFQICDPKSCKPPAYVTLPEVTLTVLAGGVAAAPGAATEVAAPAPAAAAAPAPSAAPPARGAAPTAAAVGAAKSEVQQAAEKGMLSFLLVSALGGLFAVAMPCVWPMIPITVNFFVKQGQQGRSRTTGLAITYCLAIVGIYVVIGILFAAVFGAASLTRLANNPWVNLFVAGLFLAFGLSLLGVFEIRLPSFLLNASAQGESRGGLIGVVFMALTLTITSFTCTFPVVGALVVMAAGGSYFYPIIGLATFAAVLALPFFLLAMAPGLLARMPRSGDWMNAVKVVGGLVEIGAAFKFLNVAETGLGATPQSAWFDAQALLSIWVVLALICGIYLLGLFKTDHDHADLKVGPGRILSGALFLTAALYFAPALFGYPPRGRIYDRLFVGLLPADAGELDATAQTAERLAALGGGGAADAAGGGAAPLTVKASSTDPEVAVREEKTFHGVRWGMSYEAAVEAARSGRKPVLIDFTGVNCANCRAMERSVMPLPEVVALLRRFETVQLYTDFVPIDSITQEQREALAEANLMREESLTQQTTSPLYVVLGPDETVMAQVGYTDPATFVQFLKDALAKHDDALARYPDGGPVARADLPAGR